MKRNEQPTDTGVSLSRRHLLAAGGGLVIAGGSAVAMTTREADAQVELGSWSVSGAEATVDSAPQSILVNASGEFRVSRPSAPEMVEVTVQADVNGQVDDLDTQAFYDTKSGSFDFSSVDLFAHRDISRGDLTPDTAGTTATVPVTLRIVISVVDGGSIVAEESTQDGGDLVLTRAGVAVAIGGSASLTVKE